MKKPGVPLGGGASGTISDWWASDCPRSGRLLYQLRGSCRMMPSVIGLSASVNGVALCSLSRVFNVIDIFYRLWFVVNVCLCREMKKDNKYPEK